MMNKASNMCSVDRLLRSLGVIGLGLMLVHGVVVTSGSVNVPYWDEWMLFRENNLAHAFNASWLVELHNEHRLVSTKLMAWLLYRSTGLNLATQVVFNFLLYGLMGWLLMRLCRRATGESVLFMWIALASTLPHEIHYWSFQSHFHVYLIFYIAALLAFLYEDHRSWAWPFLATASAYCFSAGVPCAVSLIAAALFWAYFAPQHRLRLVVQSASCSVMTATWFIGFHKNPGHPAFVLPHRSLFWRTVFGALGRGFGWGHRGVFVFGAIILMSLALLCGRQLWLATREQANKPERLVLVAFVGAALLGVAQTSIARAAFFPHAESTPSRYLEGILVLAPALAALGLEAIGKRAVLRSLFAIALIAPFCSHLNFARAYSGYTSQMRANQECVRQAIVSGGPGLCPMTYPEPIRPFLLQARELRVGFVEALLPAIYTPEKTWAPVDLKGPVDCKILAIQHRAVFAGDVVRLLQNPPSLVVQGRLVVNGSDFAFPPDVSILLESPKDSPRILPAHRTVQKRNFISVLSSFREGPEFQTQIDGVLDIPRGTWRASVIFTQGQVTYRCPEHLSLVF